MNFLTALLGPSETKSVSVDDLWDRVAGGAQSKAGIPVNWQSALRVSVAFSCARVLAEGIAQIPFKIMKEIDGGGSLPARDHHLYQLAVRRPNDWMTSFQFRETMMLHAIFAKGGYAVKNIVGGKVRELIPLVPGSVRVEADSSNVITYWANMPDGTYRPFKKESIFHLRGPSWDGIEGLDVIDLAREALGIALATEQTHASFHKNGAKAAGIVSLDGELKPEGRNALRKAFQDASTGNNAFKTLVLDQGAKFSQMSMTGVDSQHLETRKYQIEEVCRFMRVFPQMAGYSDKTSTFASAEQFFIAHVVHSLGPWVERWEQTFDRDCFSEADIKEGYFSKLTVQGLMRGAHKDRAEYFSRALGSGGSPAWMTQDEVRALDDLNPMGGDAATLREPPNSQKAPDSVETPVQKAMSDQVTRAIDDIREVKSLVNMSLLAPKTPVLPGNTEVKTGDQHFHFPEKLVQVYNEATKQAHIVVNVPETPSPAIHVAAPTVNVAAPTVNVAPAEVKVDVAAPNVSFEAVMPAMPTPNVIVSLPPRKTETVVTRDNFGNIITATQLEQDA